MILWIQLDKNGSPIGYILKPGINAEKIPQANEMPAEFDFIEYFTSNERQAG